jgi:hypothetical protein
MYRRSEAQNEQIEHFPCTGKICFVSREYSHATGNRKHKLLYLTYGANRKLKDCWINIESMQISVKGGVRTTKAQPAPEARLSQAFLQNQV